MAQGLNNVQIIGNLGQDPEVRYGQNGNAVCNLRVAINEKKKDGDKWVDHVEWITVVVFGKTAENVAKYLVKGRSAFFEGRLQTRKWSDKDGNEKQTTEIVARNVLFLGGGDNGGQRTSNAGDQEKKNDHTQGKPGAQSKPDGDDGFYDDDLPF